MNIYDQLLDERNQLETIIQKTSKFLSHAPDGTLKVSKNYFYQGKKVQKKRKFMYLSLRKDKELIQNLALKRYYSKVLKTAKEQLEVIDDFLVKYYENSISDVFDSLNSQLKNFITPFVIERKDFCKCTSEATTETVQRSPEVDLAGNLIAICEAFLQSKGCRPQLLSVIVDLRQNIFSSFIY